MQLQVPYPTVMQSNKKMIIKLKLGILLCAYLLVIPVIARATSVFPSDIIIEPTAPNKQSFIILTVNGNFSTPGYTLIEIPLLDITDNIITVGFGLNSPDNPVITTLDPFAYPVNLGNLEAGKYTVIVNFSVDGLLDNTIQGEFEVFANSITSILYLLLLETEK